ncbi:hypothetical protein FCM35_KLT09494 [Carex littledalei]|uniref:Uncharacterized protein n=1 Tax=Carex littledalei TaxID=544730 RepID=A0A833VSR7_9POAL|nr:hypothetical protein FCM35_KLT09494 [Carex littledalei]
MLVIKKLCSEKCIIFVIPNGDKPAGNPTGANIIIGNAPPDAPSNTYTKLPRQPTVRIYSEANRDLSVTVRNGTVVLAPADSNDHYQHWIKDMSYSNEVRYIHGLPAFALVNRVTGEALKNPIGENQQVSLVPYKPNRLKDPVKWTESLSTGFRTIRITDTPTLNMTALTTSDCGTIPDDGTKIVSFNDPVSSLHCELSHTSTLCMDSPINCADSPPEKDDSLLLGHDVLEDYIIIR